MFNHKLIFENQMFKAGMTIPANAKTDAPTAVRVGGIPNRLAVTVVTKTETKITAAKKITITLTECDTEAGSFAAPTANPSMVVTMSATTPPAQTIYAIGDRIASLVLPENIGKWVKASITTDDTGATGTIDVFLEYLGV
jgi:hypothetical protein